MADPTPDDIEKLKSAHGEIRQLEKEGYHVIIRPPKRQEWKRFRTAAADERKRADALEILFRDCCVYPEKEAVEEMLNRRPGLAEVFGGEAMEFAGGGKDAEKKDL